MPVSPPACTNRTPRPSRECALVCASVVAAHDPGWLAAPVSSLLGDRDRNPSQLSRLKAAVLPFLEEAILRATRRGRPRQAKDDTRVRLAACEALLEVARATLSGLRIRDRRAQERLVHAAERLGREHGIGRDAFAGALGLSARTLRSWRSRKPVREEEPRPLPPESPAPSEKAAKNVGRFDLEVCPPGLQAVGDTTDLRIFGIKLKLVGGQDLGGRHRKLLSSFRVVQRESSRVVAEVLGRVFRDPRGTQGMVDQGKPYVAEATREALDTLGMELCPQKEGTPTEKATLERAWRTIKEAVGPLFALTERLGQAFPALRNAELAASVGELLVATFLRVYFAARRDLPHPLEGKDPSLLAGIVEERREQAYAERRSQKLLLEEIHACYAMPGSAQRFVHAHRRRHLEDIVEAERRLRTKACRCQTGACDRYFAGILANVARESESGRSARRRAERELRERRERDREWESWLHCLDENPDVRLQEALGALAATWLPTKNDFFLPGGGPFRQLVRDTVTTLADRQPVFWKDDVERVWNRCAAGEKLSPGALCATRTILDDLVGSQAAATARHPLPGPLSSHILPIRARPPATPHPRRPRPDLRI